ncbi:MULTISPECIES: YceI family protein [Deinococcus]|uniref:YceI family protein n=1 Tax=Deinococcus rufus TaxID=2136097 RepID=A0ABV7ZCB7_9DEIO|nr:YceI family protein [Deinococcus sp. AB2017081]WQE94110.1 YceI family protein [Deinococcus sp. AB2017081]
MKTSPRNALPLMLLLGSMATAAPVTYTVISNPTLNLMTAESSTVVENIVARTPEVSGTLSFDSAAKVGSGKVTVNGASIKTGMTARDGHMRSEAWLNFDKTPAIVFETTGVKHVSGDQYDVIGNLTLNGVTRPVTSRATVKLTPASDATRAAGAKGDVLAVSTAFKVKLSDHKVTNARIPNQVSDTLAISLKFIASNK